MRISDWSSDVCSSDLDDSVFGQLAACPDIGERRDIAVEHARASEDQKDRRREVLPLLDADVRCLLQLIDAPRPGEPGVLGDLVADIAIEARRRIATDGADGGHPVQLRPLVVGRTDEPSMCPRSEEHTSELQSLMRISYAVFCLKKKRT